MCSYFYPALFARVRRHQESGSATAICDIRLAHNFALQLAHRCYLVPAPGGLHNRVLKSISDVLNAEKIPNDLSPEGAYAFGGIPDDEPHQELGARQPRCSTKTNAAIVACAWRKRPPISESCHGDISLTQILLSWYNSLTGISLVKFVS